MAKIVWETSFGYHRLRIVDPDYGAQGLPSPIGTASALIVEYCQGHNALGDPIWLDLRLPEPWGQYLLKSVVEEHVQRNLAEQFRKKSKK